MALGLAPSRILFVPQGTKQTSQRDRELQKSQALAHAARESHQKKREKRADFGTDNVKDGPANSNKLPPITGYLAVRRKNANANTKQPSRSVVLSPINHLLAQSRCDPFESGVGSRLPSVVVAALEFGYDILWPSLFPVHPDLAQSHATTRRRLGREHEIVLHAHIYAIYSFILGFHIFQDNSMWPLACSARKFHEARAMELIEQQMRATVGAPSDTLLHATLLVGFCPEGPPMPTLDHYPPSPLATAQLLNIFGTARLVPERLRMIYDCVSGKGGLNAIRFQGLKDMLRIEDLIRASRTGTKPVYLDWAWREEFIEAMSAHRMDDQAFRFSSSLGVSFVCIEDLGLREVLSMACTVTVALDQYHRKAPNSPSLWNLTRARNATQWLLCCLEPFSPQETKTHGGLHNVCRQAALIYSDKMLFPIPENTTVKARLAADLRSALSRCKSLESHDCGCSSLLTWAVVMGGIAALDTVHHQWYASLLSRRLAAQISDWAHFKDFLSQFLWWEHVLGLPTRNLWDDAMVWRWS